MEEYLVLDADLYIPTGTPATAEQVQQWLEEGTISQEIYDQLGPEQQIEANSE